MSRALALVVLAGCAGAAPPPTRTPDRRTSPTASDAPAPAEGSAPPARATLEERLDRVHERSGPGRPPISDLRRDTLAEGATRDHAVPMRAGWCYLVIAAGDDDVSDLDLFLYDPAGYLVGWDHASDPTPVVRVCTSVDGTYRLTAKMFAGHGEFALRVFGERTRRAREPAVDPVELPLSE